MLTYDRKQYNKVKEKLLWMGEHCPELMQLDLPVDRDAVAALERGQGIALPRDYKAVITHVAAGGLSPPFWSSGTGEICGSAAKISNWASPIPQRSRSSPAGGSRCLWRTRTSCRGSSCLWGTASWAGL